MAAYEWIDKLEESNSRLHKEEVIKQALVMAELNDEHAIEFLEGSFMALSPFVTFGVKQIPEKVSATVETDHYYMFNDLAMRLHTRELTGHAARDAILACMESFTVDGWNKLARRVLMKDLRCGASGKTFNKILAGTKYEIPEFSCQLAQDSKNKPKKMKGVKRLEVKLDGVRVLAYVPPPNADGEAEVIMCSRNGLELLNFPGIALAIRDVLAPRLYSLAAPMFDSSNETATGVYLDGEVMSATFQDLMKQVHRKKNATTDDCVYHIFDIIPAWELQKGEWQKSQKDRLKLLSMILPESLAVPGLKAMPGIEVDLDTDRGHAIMHEFATDAVERGFEGILIKDLSRNYECKRSDSWLKWKPTITVDLTIVGLEEGAGKFAGTLGSLLLKGTDDGRDISVSCGGGMSDQLRAELWAAGDTLHGQVVEVEADAITQNQDGTYSLRFPRLKRFRGFEKGDKL